MKKEKSLMKDYRAVAVGLGQLWMRRVAAIAIAFMAVASSAEESPTGAADSLEVEVYIEHALMLPWGKPGFRIGVERWTAHGALSLDAIGPGGAKVELVPATRPLHADGDGSMMIDLGYDTKGLTPGHWFFLVVGEPGVHMIATDLPRVVAPEKSNQEWGLIFGDEKAKTGDGLGHALEAVPD